MVHMSQIRALPRGPPQFAGLLTRHEPDLLMTGVKVGEVVGAIGSGALALDRGRRAHGFRRSETLSQAQLASRGARGYCPRGSSTSTPLM